MGVEGMGRKLRHSIVWQRWDAGRITQWGALLWAGVPLFAQGSGRTCSVWLVTNACPKLHFQYERSLQGCCLLTKDQMLHQVGAGLGQLCQMAQRDALAQTLSKPGGIPPPLMLFLGQESRTLLIPSPWLGPWCCWCPGASSPHPCTSPGSG